MLLLMNQKSGAKKLRTSSRILIKKRTNFLLVKFEWASISIYTDGRRLEGFSVRKNARINWISLNRDGEVTI